MSSNGVEKFKPEIKAVEAMEDAKILQSILDSIASLIEAVGGVSERLNAIEAKGPVVNKYKWIKATTENPFTLMVDEMIETYSCDLIVCITVIDVINKLREAGCQFNGNIAHGIIDNYLDRLVTAGKLTRYADGIVYHIPRRPKSSSQVEAGNVSETQKPDAPGSEESVKGNNFSLDSLVGAAVDQLLYDYAIKDPSEPITFSALAEELAPYIRVPIIRLNSIIERHLVILAINGDLKVTGNVPEFKCRVTPHSKFIRNKG